MRAQACLGWRHFPHVRQNTVRWPSAGGSGNMGVSNRLPVIRRTHAVRIYSTSGCRQPVTAPDRPGDLAAAPAVSNGPPVSRLLSAGSGIRASAVPTKRCGDEADPVSGDPSTVSTTTLMRSTASHASARRRIRSLGGVASIWRGAPPPGLPARCQDADPSRPCRRHLRESRPSRAPAGRSGRERTTALGTRSHTEGAAREGPPAVAAVPVEPPGHG